MTCLVCLSFCILWHFECCHFAFSDKVIQTFSKFYILILMTSSPPTLCLKYFWFCSPEHPSIRARGRSMLSGDRSGDRTAFRDFTDDQATSRLSSFLSLISALYCLVIWPHFFLQVYCAFCFTNLIYLFF